MNRRAGRLSRLSDWLQTRERGAMADRLFTQGLAQDVKEYRQQTGDRKIDADLLRLQRYQQVIDGNRALGISLPEDAPGNTVRQPSPPQDPLAMPATPSDGAWDLWRRLCNNPHHHRPHRSADRSRAQTRIFPQCQRHRAKGLGASGGVYTRARVIIIRRADAVGRLWRS